MADKISIDRTSAGGRYANLLDVAEYLSGRYGSSANALKEMAEESATYKKALKPAKHARKAKAAADSASEPPGGPGPGAP